MNQTYKDNILSLENFAMIKFLNDTVVQPRESEVCIYYKSDVLIHYYQSI